MSATNKKNQSGTSQSSDVLIAGGGYVGLSVAVALAHEAPHLDVTIVEIAPEKAILGDERASAIAAAASRMLDHLGIWKKLEADAQPINEMIVTDSKLSDAIRPVFLTFINEPTDDDQSTRPYAHMLANRDLVSRLREAAKNLGVKQVFGAGVSSFEQQASHMDVTLSTGKILQTKLLVAADGVRSKIREAAGIKTVHWPYDQCGIVTTVSHERDHGGRAEEHFLPAGPFAILPLKGRRSSLVWTESSKDSERLMALDDFSFELELEKRFGHKLGEISVDGSRRAFPLGLTLARSFIANRLALVGDAAHGIHPISGQGLNLGFKDAAALAETIIDADRLGLDMGSQTTLERYEQWRRFDTVRMGVVTDVLNRLFSNDNAILRIARDVGLGMVDRMPGLKKQFIEQAAGNQSEQPRLLRGEGI